MPHYIAERLRAEDASFLLFESPNAHMHLSWVWVFDGGSLVRADGGGDITAIRQHVAARLFRFPRFRQRLAWTPVERYPSWVDDETFKLRYHVRHVALPDPGDEAHLRTTVGAIVSQPLDRSKPLWELWVVEGLADGRFAVVTKTHHCMMDGLSTVDLMHGLLDADPHAHPDEVGDWIPRPAPPPTALLRDGIIERLGTAARLVDASRRALVDRQAWRRTLSAAEEMLGAGFARPPATPFNRAIGPHRLVNWIRVPSDELRRTAEQLGATEQDVRLAAVGGAIGKLLAREGAEVPGDVIRVVVPLTARGGGRAGEPGNRTDAAVVVLPIAERDPRRRVRAIARATTEARRGGAALHNLDGLLRVAGLGGRTILGLGLAVRRRLYACNLVVTDIPGPGTPLHLLDARLVEAYPLVPLLDDQGLGIAFTTYDGGCYAGLVADWETVPGLSRVADDLRLEFDLLCRADVAPRRIERLPGTGSARIVG